MGGDLIITGGVPLNGTVRIPAAKNSVLPLLAASLLCSGTVRLLAVPQLADVDTSLVLLRGAGCAARWQGSDITVQSMPSVCRLEQEGLITILPKKGLMVSGITEEDVHSMFEMRLLVEPYALRTYGSSITREQLEAFAELMHHPDRITDFCESDDAFHELLMSTLPNKYLRSAYDRITGLNTRFRIMTGKVSMINQEQTCEEHLEILDAALADNWDLAADSLQHHLELARDKAEGVIKVIRLW